MFQIGGKLRHSRINPILMFTADQGKDSYRVPRVQKRRNASSSSNNLKEAFCEKIPVHYDLLRNFRKQHGPSLISNITVDDIYEGLQGVNTMVKETSEIDPKYGIKYRGLTIPQVINVLPREGNSPSAEAVFWLLMTGDVPTKEQTASLIADWSSRRRKRKEWWSGNEGGIVGSVLRGLPSTVTPLSRLSIALMVLDTGKQTKAAIEGGALSHTHWEYMYEDSMELIAVLPAIVGLVGKSQELTNLSEEGDWVSFLVECLCNMSDDLKSKSVSVGDFLRLYVALNADEDGGIPGAHVTQILGSSLTEPNAALAAGILAYADEPKSGTLSQYMEFHSKLKRALGSDPTQETLKDFITTFIRENKLVAHKNTTYCDPRYTTLLNYAKAHLSDDAEVKLSQDISRTLAFMTKNAKGRSICPEQNAIAAPIFQSYGLKDMKFNQVLYCISRTLGAIASIIWSRAINSPVEHPKSSTTHTYLESLSSIKPRKRIYRKKFHK